MRKILNHAIARRVVVSLSARKANANAIRAASARFKEPKTPWWGGIRAALFVIAYPRSGYLINWAI
jgi:hypothetical protein